MSTVFLVFSRDTMSIDRLRRLLHLYPVADYICDWGVEMYHAGDNSTTPSLAVTASGSRLTATFLTLPSVLILLRVAYDIPISRCKPAPKMRLRLALCTDHVKKVNRVNRWEDAGLSSEYFLTL